MLKWNSILVYSTEWAGVARMFQSCIKKVPHSNYTRTLAVLTDSFRGLSQSHKKNADQIHEKFSV
jgi:hypothetical protein